MNRIKRRKHPTRFGNGGKVERVGGMGRNCAGQSLICAGQSLRIRMEGGCSVLCLAREGEVPVVIEPNAQFAGNGRVGGVREVEPNLEGCRSVSLRAHHASWIVRLQGGSGWTLLV